jgi:uracil-DNA glycosylase
MTISFDAMLDAAFRGRDVEDILDASPSALSGVSGSDAQHLDDALGIDSVRKMAENRFFDRARAVLAASGRPGFDPGPPPDWEDFFQSAPIQHYVNHPAGRFRLHFGPVYYRGRLDGSARVLAVGQDPSTNEILSQRNFVGRSGQRVQGLLAKLGITRSYSMVNTFLFSVFGQFNTELRNISLEPEILDYRNAYLDRLADRNPVQAVIAFGSGARHAVEQWPGAGAFPVFELFHPAAQEPDVNDSWNAALPGIQAVVDPDEDGVVDPNPYGQAFTPADEVTIPRFDLNFGVPDWHGVNGGHSSRDGDDKIVWNAP